MLQWIRKGNNLWLTQGWIQSNLESKKHLKLVGIFHTDTNALTIQQSVMSHTLQSVNTMATSCWDIFLWNRLPGHIVHISMVPLDLSDASTRSECSLWILTDPRGWICIWWPPSTLFIGAWRKKIFMIENVCSKLYFLNYYLCYTDYLPELIFLYMFLFLCVYEQFSLGSVSKGAWVM